MDSLASEARSAVEAHRSAAVEVDTSVNLTPREHEVLEHVAEGLSNKEIGDQLHASQHTIANHVRAILQKTGTTNRTEAARWAHQQQLLG
jgi:DNA-binding NarL/FixJ family response regulator